MINPEDIRPYRTTAADFSETQELKRHLHSLKQTRNPFYLDVNGFDRILRWKLRQQYGRQEYLRSQNTDKVIKEVTSVALNISHHNKDYELELRFKLLIALKGVGIPVASAMLALCYPEEYAVIDFRGWRQMFGERKTSFTLNDYKRYLREIKDLADKLGWPPQEVDLAIWDYDIRENRKR